MDLTGREVVIAARKAATWGTAVECGATHGILTKDSFDLGEAIEHLADESVGLDFVGAADLGKVTVEGSLGAWLRYEGLETMLALAMGTAGAPAQQGVTAAYRHTLQLATVVDGLFQTMAEKKKSDLVFEWPGVKVAGFTMKFGFRMPTEITFPLIADGLNRNNGSGTNTPTTIANVTYRSKGLRVILDENGYVRMNDQAGGALGGGDAITPTEVTLTFRRPLKGEHVVDGTIGIDEPRSEGFPEITLAMKFPQFSTPQADVWDDFDAKTGKKLKLYCRGPLIGGGYYHELLLSFPHLEVTQITAPISGPGKIPTDITFRVMEAAAAPTGMAVTKPFQIELQNTITTDALA